MGAVVNKDKLDASQPQFFKVFLPDVNSNWLHIPLGFVKHLKNTTSGSVLLTGPSGNTWKVNLVRSNGGLFFREGWAEFVGDHFAEYGDFFVFRYDSNFHFTVTIFDKSACEKQVAFQAKCNQDISHFVEKRGKKREKVLQPDSSSYRSFEGARQRRRTNTLSEVMHIKNEKVGPSGTEAEFDDEARSKVGAKVEQYKSSMQTETYEKRSCRRILAQHHPCFVRRMTKGNVQHVFVMYIPANFMKEHLGGCPNRKIVLRNPQGNQWLVNLVRRGGSGSLCAGWGSFVRDNRIQAGDTCRFELVGEFEMLVHVSRCSINKIQQVDRPNLIKKKSVMP